MAQFEGPERGLEEIHGIADRDRLAAYPFYHAALGEFELRSGKQEIARGHFRAALALARNPMERRFLEQRIGACDVAAPEQAPYWRVASRDSQATTAEDASSLERKQLEGAGLCSFLDRISSLSSVSSNPLLFSTLAILNAGRGLFG